MSISLHSVPGTIPKIIFIVPYRNREQQRQFFLRHMGYIMEDYAPEDYRIYFVHQRYRGTFNRGGMKNAGVRVMQEIYPHDWPNITFVFNDVDCMPYTKNFLPFETTYGVVKHFYGFRNTLGGIVSMTGQTFVDCHGFPMFYGYGFEDNLLQQRVLKAGFVIDRRVFFPLYDPNILSFRDGNFRDVNKTEFDAYIHGNVTEGIHSIRILRYEFDNDETTHYLHIDELDFGRQEHSATTTSYDLRKGNAPFRPPKELQVAPRIGGKPHNRFLM